MDIQVREATPTDLPALRVMEQGVISAERPMYDDIPKSDICYYDLEALMTSSTSCLVIAETADGTPVGSGYCDMRQARAYLPHQHLGYIGFMYVDPNYRGQNINQQVIEHLVAWGKKQGLNRFHLDVYTVNASAIRAYEKAGFKPLLMDMMLTVDD